LTAKENIFGKSDAFVAQMIGNDWRLENETSFEFGVFPTPSLSHPSMPTVYSKSFYDRKAKLSFRWNLMHYPHRFTVTMRVSPPRRALLFHNRVCSILNPSMAEVEDIIRMQNELYVSSGTWGFRPVVGDLNVIELRCELQKVFGVVDAKPYCDEMEFWEAYMGYSSYWWRNHAF
jgi:hypothetical protein